MDLENQCQARCSRHSRSPRARFTAPVPVQVEALREKDPAILGIFKNEKASEFATFSKVADQLSDDFDFGHIFDSDLAEEVVKAPSVVIYKDTEAKTLKYNGKFKVKDLEAWVESNALPLLPELDQ